MHAKSWAIDGNTVLTGSANFTNNGIENSEELLTVVRNDEYAAKYMDWFERLWMVASEVTTEGVQAAIASSAQRRR